MDESAALTDNHASNAPFAEQASGPYVGRWRQLVSTTNWEKGRIIAQWREALVAAGAAAVEYSDDAWSKWVGGVTGQHVGRLRRVFQRFGAVHGQYVGLFWSHFHSAVDWSDAEMWLEGAVQNGWSVSEMRRVRWETLGAVEELRPNDTEVTASELDEDLVEVAEPTHESKSSTSSTSVEPDISEEGPAADQQPAENDGEETGPALVQPFADIGPLPHDLAEALDAFRLAILRHKTAGWVQVAPADVLNSLEALKNLVTAPSAVGTNWSSP